jgi:hypothetical protein
VAEVVDQHLQISSQLKDQHLHVASQWDNQESPNHQFGHHARSKSQKQSAQGNWTKTFRLTLLPAILLSPTRPETCFNRLLY